VGVISKGSLALFDDFFVLCSINPYLCISASIDMYAFRGRVWRGSDFERFDLGFEEKLS